MRAIGIVWTVVAVGAGLMGVALISDEPGATAGRWYLAFAAAAAVLAVGAFRGPASRNRVLIGSIVLLAAIALHYFVIVAFAYSGLTMLLLVPAALAVLIAVADWARNGSKRPAS